MTHSCKFNNISKESRLRSTRSEVRILSGVLKIENCYDYINNIDVLEWAYKNKIDIESINDYHLLKAQRDLGIRLYYGSVFITTSHKTEYPIPMNWTYITVCYID